MNTNVQKFLAAGMAALLACATPAFAEKPEWAGQGKDKHAEKHGAKHEGKHDRKQAKGGDVDVNVRIGAYFGDAQRVAARDYYAPQFRAGKCPPGLAKKNNGCLPPGQARKWAIGQPLPRDVVYYPVPAAVIVQLGAPPAGHKYVRVAADILLIAVGTSMVIDAIEDLSRM